MHLREHVRREDAFPRFARNEQPHTAQTRTTLPLPIGVVPVSLLFADFSIFGVQAIVTRPTDANKHGRIVSIPAGCALFELRTGIFKMRLVMNREILLAAAALAAEGTIAAHNTKN
jgi:hypothetical protein